MPPDPAEARSLPDQDARRRQPCEPGTCWAEPLIIVADDLEAEVVRLRAENEAMREERDANAAECRRLVVEYADRAPARCQHCPTPTPADERSFMCEGCASKADEEAQELRDEIERLRRLIGEAYTQRGTRPMQALRELFGASRSALTSDEEGRSDA